MKTENHECSLGRIEQVMEQEPELGYQGFGDTGGHSMLADHAVQAFEDAVNWLNRQRALKRTSRHASAYDLKNRVQDYIRGPEDTGRLTYISVGMMIVAAIDMGFLIKRRTDRHEYLFDAFLNVGMPLNMGDAWDAWYRGHGRW